MMNQVSQLHQECFHKKSLLLTFKMYQILISEIETRGSFKRA